MNQRPPLPIKRYIYALIITIIPFVFAIYLYKIVSQKQVINISDVEEQILLNLKSSDIEFELLKEAPCQYITETNTSESLNNLAQKIEWFENNPGQESELEQLKKSYTLLQIKDYLVAKRLQDKCQKKQNIILYFYNKDCKNCQDIEKVLDILREENKELRIYNFDTELKTNSINTLKNLFKVENAPTIIHNDKHVENIETLLKKQKTKIEKTNIKK